jgi:hypothetical protein
MKYVSCMGAVWRLSEQEFRRLMEVRAAGRDFVLDHFGPLVVPSIALDVTDLTAEEAQAEIEALKAVRRK